MVKKLTLINSRYLLAIAYVFLSVIGHSGNLTSPKKQLRLKLKGERLYENFAYSKAVVVFEKSLDIADQPNEDVFIKIADSYRQMNNTVSAEKWYEKAADSEFMTDLDRLNYSQILVKNGKEGKAQDVLNQIKSENLVLTPRMAQLENSEIYYSDSAAYSLQNLEINTEESDFSPAYFEEGIVFVSNRKNKRLSQNTYYWDDSFFLDLYYTRLSEGQYEEPLALTKQINTIFHEGPATFFDNDSKIIFTRNNFSLGEERTSAEGINKLKLYYAEKNKKGKWSKPVSLPFVDDNHSFGHPTMSPDGKTLYFASDMSGTYGKGDIWKVDFNNGEWGTPINLGNQINTADNEIFPFITESSELYFSSEGHPGLGGLDIYKVDLMAEEIKIENPGFPINTHDDDFGIIYKNGKGYISSNRLGGAGKDDIYLLKEYNYNIRIRLIDSLSGDPIQGDIKVSSVRDGSIIAENRLVYNVSFNTLRGRNFNVVAESGSYSPKEIEINTGNFSPMDENLVFNVPLTKRMRPVDILWVKNEFKPDQLFRILDKPEVFSGDWSGLELTLEKDNLTLNNVIEIKSIHYDFDKYDIHNQEISGLDSIVWVLNTFENLTVLLESHTDSRGAVSYNEKLSKKRMVAAHEYLISKGINSNRIVTKYWGESQPLVSCDSINCSENDHRKNRRTEVYFIQQD